MSEINKELADSLTKKQCLVPPEQAAEHLNVTTRTLANWRSRGTPNVPFSKIGRCVKYRLSDLDAYIAKNSHNAVEVQQ
jgi:phage terminase Nu1 subunit (DNA packaging protein)